MVQSPDVQAFLSALAANDETSDWEVSGSAGGLILRDGTGTRLARMAPVGGGRWQVAWPRSGGKWQATAVAGPPARVIDQVLARGRGESG